MKTTPLKYRLNVIGGALIIFVCIRTYIPMLAQQLGMRENFNIWLVVYMVTLALSCLVPIAFIEKMCDFHPKLFQRHTPSVADGMLIANCIFIFILLAMANSVVITLAGRFGIVFPPQKLETIDNPLTFVLYFVFSAIIPAVFEELFIRGTVMNLLLPNGRRYAILASAVIFTMMHTQVQSFIPVFGAGVVLACIYMYTGSIYLSMALHFVNNSYSFMMLYMQQRLTGISLVGFASYVMAVIIVFGMGSMMWLKKRNINIFSCLEKQGKEPKLVKFFACPVMVLGMVCCLMAILTQLYADLTM